MLIGADRLFASSNESNEKLMPSSPKANGEGHGRFENLLYQTSTKQDDPESGNHDPRPSNQEEGISSQLSKLMDMTTPDGRLTMPSFINPVENGKGSMVASQVKMASSTGKEGPSPMIDENLELEDISSSQLEDLLNLLLGPVALAVAPDLTSPTPSQGDAETSEAQQLYPLGDTGPIESQKRHPLGDTGPIESPKRHPLGYSSLDPVPQVGISTPEPATDQLATLSELSEMPIQPVGLPQSLIKESEVTVSTPPVSTETELQLVNPTTGLDLQSQTQEAQRPVSDSDIKKPAPTVPTGLEPKPINPATVGSTNGLDAQSQSQPQEAPRPLAGAEATVPIPTAPTNSVDAQPQSLQQETPGLVAATAATPTNNLDVPTAKNQGNLETVVAQSTTVLQDSAPQRMKLSTSRTLESRGYSTAAESVSIPGELEEGSDVAKTDPQRKETAIANGLAKETPVFVSSWTVDKKEEKLQEVPEKAEKKLESGFQKVADHSVLENTMQQGDLKTAPQTRSESPIPTQTMYLPQKGPDALPYGLAQVVRHVMADGTQRATVIIDPPALGRIEVEIHATAAGMEASFRVENAQIRDMIKPQLPLLQDMLSQQGIVASAISVDIRQGDERRSPWRDSLEAIKLRKRRGLQSEEEQEISSMEIARIDMERGVLQWYA